MFKLGTILITPGAQAVLDQVEAEKLLYRHHNCDWGDLSDSDKQLNEDALATKERLFSCYKVREGVKVYIITEADRSATTIMMSEEY